MEPRQGNVLEATKGAPLITITRDDMSWTTSPNWSLAEAVSSTASADQTELDAVRVHGPPSDDQLSLKNELELIKTQLYAQTQAFEALSRSITLLEQESNYRQQRVKQLEDELKFATRSARGEMFEGLMHRKFQEIWKAMNKEIEGLQDCIARKDNSLESLSQEVLESKKFLWEELETMQGDVRRIHQKLKGQELDITRNLVNIKKVQDSQVRCHKLLSQIKGKILDDSAEPVDSKATSRELTDIWSAVNSLRNSFSTFNIWSDKRKPPRMKGQSNYQYQKLSSAGSSSGSKSAVRRQHHSGSEHST